MDWTGELSDERSLLHRELRRAPPPERALTWICGVFGAGSRIASVTCFEGGSDHAVHGIVIQTEGGAHERAVLRRWVRPGWRLSDPDCTPDREATALTLLTHTAIPAPDVLSVDSEGRDCDVPALLMSWLPGSTDLPGSEHRSAFLQRLAETARALHDLEPPALPSFRPHSFRANMRPPSNAVRPAVWLSAFEFAERVPPDALTRFIHRDYHPGNILHDRGRITGIVDWINASRGPTGVDLSHMRWNLLLRFGEDAPDDFLQRYRALAPADCHDHPYWDVRTVIDLCPEPAQGALTAHETNRLEHYLERCMART